MHHNRPTDPLESNQPHTQPADDGRDPVEYLRTVVDNQIVPSTALEGDAPAGYETDQSALFITEYAAHGDGTRRLRLRLQHPDSTESDVSPMLSPAEMDVFLRGLAAGVRGEIGRKADLIDDEDQP